MKVPFLVSIRDPNEVRVFEVLTPLPEIMKIPILPAKNNPALLDPYVAEAVRSGMEFIRLRTKEWDICYVRKDADFQEADETSNEASAD